MICQREEKPVSRDDLVKGFEVSKGKYVQITTEELDALERQVPDLAEIATKTAYARALLVSDSVLRVDSGDLVRMSLDGSRTVVAQAKPRRKVKVGEVITVRRIADQSAAGRA
jgi:hypothetical protein